MEEVARNMNETSGGGTTFRISIGLAFIGGYADASSYLLAGVFTGHLTGNCVLAAVSAASKEWFLTLDRLLAVFYASMRDAVDAVENLDFRNFTVSFLTSTANCTDRCTLRWRVPEVSQIRTPTANDGHP